MKILVLGGTRFVGRHIVTAALESGHEVSVFNRGRSAGAIFPEVEQLVGDRHKDLRALENRKWDVVIDSSGYVPNSVEVCTTLLSRHIDSYIYVSTVSVYNDFSKTPIDENTAVYGMTDSANEKAELVNLEKSPTGADYGDKYGVLKAECERVVESVMLDRSLIVRLGLVVGAHDYSNRFPYWVARIAKGGDVLAPGKPEYPIRIIDCRDAAEWIVNMAEKRGAGIFNVAGRNDLTFGDFFNVCREVTSSTASFSWVNEKFLLDNGVEPWQDLPLWLPTNLQSRFLFDSSAAEEQGLRYRSIGETIEDTHRWIQEDLPEFEIDCCLTQEREAELLGIWRLNCRTL